MVKFGGLAVPGATVTATQGDKKLVAITDPRGIYEFADLADGLWNLQVEMLCFATLKNEVAVAPHAPSPEWELKLLPLDEIKAAAPLPAPPAGAAGATTPAATVSATAASPAAATPPAKMGSKAAKAAAAAAAEEANARPGFQRADLNASNLNGSNLNPSSEPPAADLAASGIDEATPGASDALLVNGSVSNGVERRAIGNFRPFSPPPAAVGLPCGSFRSSRHRSCSSSRLPTEGKNSYQLPTPARVRSTRISSGILRVTRLARGCFSISTVTRGSVAA